MSALPQPRVMEEHELGEFNGASIDLRGCTRLEIVVTLYEHETAGLRFETWPHAVQTQVEKHLTDWIARNTERAPRAVTTAVINRGCVLVLHHAKK